MKRLCIMVVLLCLLSGCVKSGDERSSDADKSAEPTAQEALPPETKEPSQENVQVASPSVSPTAETEPHSVPTYTLSAFTDAIPSHITETILADYAEFDALGKGEQYIKQSTMNPVGSYSESFESWNECEGYFGFSLPNPYIDVEWLTPDVLPVNAYWQGERNGQMPWLIASTSYMCDELKINYGITVNTMAQSVESEIYALYEIEEYEVLSETPAVYVFEEEMDSSSKFRYGLRAIIIKDNVYYNLSVLAPAGQETEARETLERLLSLLVDLA